jgi:hypothetical protein
MSNPNLQGSQQSQDHKSLPHFTPSPQIPLYNPYKATSNPPTQPMSPIKPTPVEPTLAIPTPSIMVKPVPVNETVETVKSVGVTLTDQAQMRGGGGKAPTMVVKPTKGTKTPATPKGDVSLSLAFVGMKYRGRHVFSSSDVVILQNDDKNQYDPNAVKVMVKKKEKWQHVAYLEREDAKKLRDVTSQVQPERASLKFSSNSYTGDTAYFRITIPRKIV